MATYFTIFYIVSKHPGRPYINPLIKNGQTKTGECKQILVEPFSSENGNQSKNRQTMSKSTKMGDGRIGPRGGWGGAGFQSNCHSLRATTSIRKV